MEFWEIASAFLRNMPWRVFISGKKESAGNCLRFVSLFEPCGGLTTFRFRVGTLGYFSKVSTKN